MTNKQIELVRNSWSFVSPIAQEAGELFYKNLFEAAPGIRHLFKSPTKDQAKKLMAMLGMVVSKLDKLDTILNDVKQLAQRHNHYGAQPEHYAVVGDVLLKTLEMGLGKRWNEETKLAWATAYGIISSAMISNQNPVEKAA